MTIDNNKELEEKVDNLSKEIAELKQLLLEQKNSGPEETEPEPEPEL